MHRFEQLTYIFVSGENIELLFTPKNFTDVLTREANFTDIYKKNVSPAYVSSTLIALPPKREANELCIYSETMLPMHAFNTGSTCISLSRFLRLPPHRITSGVALAYFVLPLLSEQSIYGLMAL